MLARILLQLVAKIRRRRSDWKPTKSTDDITKPIAREKIDEDVEDSTNATFQHMARKR